MRVLAFASVAAVAAVAAVPLSGTGTLDKVVGSETDLQVDWQPLIDEANSHLNARVSDSIQCVMNGTTETCAMTEFPRDSSVMIYPGGDTRCMYEKSSDFGNLVKQTCLAFLPVFLCACARARVCGYFCTRVCTLNNYPIPRSSHASDPGRRRQACDVPPR